ncbi:phage shock protein PspA [Polymorphobacter multimanifer]|uniref:Phage shock protein A n=2 Tax=Polymorphobacter multimanifer TaxID=1070431 RepID=A0A841L4R3_9SPHN|nr:phage shock protein A [Polymorphobacter multimanifer]GGI76519.1 phage shock protein PspA [Polymorphobacter multimanifer]
MANDLVPLVGTGRLELTGTIPRLSRRTDPFAGHRPRQNQDRQTPDRNWSINTMGIFSRTRDIIAANVTDLLDKAEDPAKMIRMIIMEMEETLVEVRASAARTIADQKEMRRAIIRAEKAQGDWGEKAELALSKGREDLARAALVEKSKARSFVEQTEAEVSALEDSLALNEADIAKLEAKLREARARQNGLLNRIESATQRSKLREMIKGPRVDDAFARFEVMERRADLAEGRADALALGGPARTLADEFAELSADDEVSAELAALKARLTAREG